MSRRKRKKDGLRSKVMKYILPSDEYGRYVPYCNLQYHRGVILNENICEKRQCSHYERLYIGSVGRLDMKTKSLNIN